MGIEKQVTPSSDQAKDHATVFAYLQSAEWEKKLEDARKKRQAVLAARAAENAEQDASVPPPEHFSVLSQLHLASAEKTVVPSDEGVSITPELPPVPEARNFWARLTVGMLAGAGLSAAALVGALIWMGPKVDQNMTTGLVSTLQNFASGYDVTIVTAQDRETTLADVDAATARLVNVRTTPFQMPTTTVAYYHDADAAAAVTLSAQVRGEIMDLRGLMPSPPEGTLDVLLAAR